MQHFPVCCTCMDHRIAQPSCYLHNTVFW